MTTALAAGVSGKREGEVCSVLTLAFPLVDQAQ